MERHILDDEKIKNAIAYIAKKHKAATGHDPYSMFMFKCLALLDFECVKRFGEPSLHLSYDGLEKGPVPNEIYDSRKPYRNDMIAMQPAAPRDGHSTYRFIASGKRINMDLFSKAEIRIMDSIVEEFSKPDKEALNRIIAATHARIHAWKIATDKNPGRRVRIDYRDQIEGEADDPRYEAYFLYSNFACND